MNGKYVVDHCWSTLLRNLVSRLVLGTGWEVWKHKHVDLEGELGCSRAPSSVTRESMAGPHDEPWRYSRTGVTSTRIYGLQTMPSLGGMNSSQRCYRDGSGCEFGDNRACSAMLHIPNLTCNNSFWVESTPLVYDGMRYTRVGLAGFIQQYNQPLLPENRKDGKTPVTLVWRSKFHLPKK